MVEHGKKMGFGRKSATAVGFALLLTLRNDAEARQARPLADPLSIRVESALWTETPEGYEAFWRRLLSDSLKTADADLVRRVITRSQGEIRAGRLSGCVYGEVLGRLRAVLPSAQDRVALEMSLCGLGWKARKRLFSEAIAGPATDAADFGVPLGNGVTWGGQWGDAALRALADGHTDLVPAIRSGIERAERARLSLEMRSVILELVEVEIPLALAEVSRTSGFAALLLDATARDCGDAFACDRRKSLIVRASYRLALSKEKNALEVLETALEQEVKAEARMGRDVRSVPSLGSELMAIGGACYSVSRESLRGSEWKHRVGVMENAIRGTRSLDGGSDGEGGTKRR